MKKHSSGSEALPGNRLLGRLCLPNCRLIMGVKEVNERRSLGRSAFPGMGLGTSANPLRSGTTIAELIVACSLLVTGMTLIAGGAVQSHRLRQDTRHYQLALDEVANQLERLVTMTSDERNAAIQNLRPSEWLESILVNPEISAETIDDEDGERVMVNLQWNRRGQAIPISLVGWIPSSKLNFLSKEASQ
ncbi:MAG: hypothetical protein SGI77_09930 [Pirellulaceae bacterium]|nr:hypothetical protein [Pirellulaceae bacterium]